MNTVWVGDWGEYPIPDEFKDVKIRKDHWPDQRYMRGREMVAYFKDKDVPTDNPRYYTIEGARDAMWLAGIQSRGST